MDVLLRAHSRPQTFWRVNSRVDTQANNTHRLAPKPLAHSCRCHLRAERFLFSSSVESTQTIDVVGLHDRVGELERESETFATAGQAREAAFQATVNASAHIYSSEYSKTENHACSRFRPLRFLILDVFSFWLWG